MGERVGLGEKMQTDTKNPAQVRVLVVDDERGARMALEVPLRLSGYDVVSASGGREAIDLGRQRRFDVVLTDIFMPGVRGIEVVREFRNFSPETKIIAMTAQGSLEIAHEAIAEGAFDFIAKPFDVEEVLALVSRATSSTPVKLPEPSPGDQDFSVSGLVGHSPQMVRAYKLTAYAARTDATVLIEGESGTGKELIARAIHNFSDRAGKPFTAVNCSALTETLLESELFGHTRGSFTGATADRAGLFESTDGGTILLDELATTSSSFQASLLRVIQEREVRRSGTRETRRTDVRVIGATNTDLEQLVERNKFRRDLFYRLSVLVIKLPPLRARGEQEIAQLARHFLLHHNQRRGSTINFSSDVPGVLASYSWPGNVRELENSIEHAVAVCSGQLITPEDLPERIIASARYITPSPAVNQPFSICDDRPTLEELNRRYIRLVLSESDGNKSRAAETLGINRRTLYRYLDPSGSADEEPEDSNSN
jgi:DNA-binding NtrC family response regulator